MPIVVVDGKSLSIPSWEYWKKEAISHVKNCVSIFNRYFVSGGLQEIKLVLDEGYVTLKVTIEDTDYDIKPSEFRWVNIEDQEEKERLKECCFAEDIWASYYATCKDKDMILHLKELCNCLGEELAGVNVNFIL